MTTIRSTHPLALAAAAALTLLSITGSAALAGLLPATALQSLGTLLPTSPAATDRASVVGTGQMRADCRICGIVESVSMTRIDHAAIAVDAAVGFLDGATFLESQASHSRTTIIGEDGVIRRNHDTKLGLQPPRIYVVTVRMADGTTRTITQAERPGYDVGDQVTVVNGALTAA